MMSLVDTHCHLQSRAFDEDRQEILVRALERLDWLVVVGDTFESSRHGVEMAGARVYAAVGVHPHHAEEWEHGASHALRDLCGRPGVVAIGEIGLDYYYEHAPREAQMKALRRQLGVACDVGVPVIIHCRDAQDDMVEILDEFWPSLRGGVMHCFSGSKDFVTHCLAWGLYISFAGNVTFPKAEDLRQAALAVPLDRLLVETDAPYLAPQPVRGRRCEPAHVLHTAEALARLHGVSFDTLARQTTRNAARLFGVKGKTA